MQAIASVQANGPIRPNKKTASEREGGKRGARGIPTTDVLVCFMVDLRELHVARSSQTIGPLFINSPSSYASMSSA
jgi:hypothetical protein